MSIRASPVAKPHRSWPWATRRSSVSSTPAHSSQLSLNTSHPYHRPPLSAVLGGRILVSKMHPTDIIAEHLTLTFSLDKRQLVEVPVNTFVGSLHGTPDPVTDSPGLDGAALGCRRPDKPQFPFLASVPFWYAFRYTSSYLMLRHSRSTKTLSMHRPLPSMLT